MALTPGPLMFPRFFQWQVVASKAVLPAQPLLPHPALRATLSRRERVVYSPLPPGEGSGVREWHWSASNEKPGKHQPGPSPAAKAMSRSLSRERVCAKRAGRGGEFAAHALRPLSGCGPRLRGGRLCKPRRALQGRAQLRSHQRGKAAGKNRGNISPDGHHGLDLEQSPPRRAGRH